MVLQGEWSRGLDPCGRDRKVPRVRVDVRVNYSELDLRDIVLVCQAGEVIGDIM